MSPLFGKKKTQEKTVLMLDIESGSVGGALVVLNKDEPPKLFGETRESLPIGSSVSGHSLSAQARLALQEVLQKLAHLAGRLRNALGAEDAKERLGAMGTVGSAAIFFAAPWGRPNLESGRPEFIPDMSAASRSLVGRYFGELPLSQHTGSGMAAFGTRALFDPQQELLCIIGGEVSELLHLSQVGVQAHASVPLGSNALYRTLQTHGGFSTHEAASAVKLPFRTARLQEPFDATARLFAGHVAEAAAEFAAPGSLASIRVVGEDHAARWLAEALSTQPALEALFPQGGSIRALRAHHLQPHIAAHVPTPDTRLMLGALFVDQNSW